MSIIRVNKNANFTVMSNHHFKEKKMSLKAKGLLSLMLSLPDTWDYSIAGLVSLSKDGKDSVMSALAELEKFGYLKRTKLINSKGQFSGVEYNIFEEPQQENPISENQNSEKQNSEKQHAENPPQSNTNKSITYNNKITNKSNTKEEDDFSEYKDILDYIEDKELQHLYYDYISMRKAIGSPLTRRGLSMLINRCVRIANFDIKIQKTLLETAIINNWKSVYAPKDEDTPPRYEKTETYNMLRDYLEGE